VQFASSQDEAAVEGAPELPRPVATLPSVQSHR
jgi:hypothetical protein